MAAELSKTQIDRLGERLKKGDISEADLRLLDLYRRSFTDAYEFVVGTIRKELKLEPTGRPSKTTTSITDKLRRESIRLTQIQDIAGCRLTTSGISSQDAVVESLVAIFDRTIVIDRRERPSHGYRAVHVVINHQSKAIEVQVRTSLQHLWAQLSEKYSDAVSPSIKYGLGDEQTRSFLDKLSSLIEGDEVIEKGFDRLREQASQGLLSADAEREIVDMKQKANLSTQVLRKVLRSASEDLDRVGE